jgi:hypothetical protein
MQMRRFRNLLACLLALPAALAQAHHSFAMFDGDKTVTIQGTVKEFQWTNPHTWIQVMVKDPTTGKEVQWSVECGALNTLERDGWTKHTAKPGDTAVVVIHQLRDGRPGGLLVSLTVNGVTHTPRLIS